MQFNTSVLSSTGSSHTSLAESEGIFFHGQSLDGATSSVSTFAPKLFETEIKNIQLVSAGIGFSVVLANGELYGCGLNTSGQLG
jgi:hypothetical protein